MSSSFPPSGRSGRRRSSLPAARLDITEKNARQAVARIADDGLIDAERHGRLVRWTLTASGQRLLEAGARRIYEFGSGSIGWDGQWLLAHCPIPESQRGLRNQLRAQLAFQGFGELSPSLVVSPHVDREPELRRTLDELDLAHDCVMLRSRTGSSDDDADLVARAWALDALAERYAAFAQAQECRRPDGAAESFRAVVELVHDWRQFPSIDPELPTELLPEGWPGTTAAEIFRDRHAAWSPAAHDWFCALDGTSRAWNNS